eukprot:jgi/Mesvir1/6963/Mv09109-RA.1
MYAMSGSNLWVNALVLLAVLHCSTAQNQNLLPDFFAEPGRVRETAVKRLTAEPYQITRLVGDKKKIPLPDHDALAKRLWPPDCKPWVLDLKDMALKVLDGSGVTLPVHNLGDNKMDARRQWDAIQLGRSGLRLGKDWAVDTWFFNDFAQDRDSFLLSGFREVTEKEQEDSTNSKTDTWAPVYALGVDDRTRVLSVFKYEDKYIYESGFRVDALPHRAWHRITIVGRPGLQRVFINGSRVGETYADVVERISFVGNGGHDLEYPWGRIHESFVVCSTYPVRMQLHLEDLQKKRAAAELARMMTTDKPMVESMSARGNVLLVGNSAKLLQLPMAGQIIDSYDVIARFNALSGVAQDYEKHFGSRVTHDILGDLTQLCGCHNGQCCNTKHAQKLVDAYKFQQVTVLFARQERIPLAFRRISSMAPNIHMMQMEPRKHFEDAMNLWLEQMEEKGHFSLVHRVPPIMAFRTGFRLLCLLLVAGVRPHIVGFDLSDEANALFTGRRKWSNLDKYVAETRLLADLVAAGLVVDITPRIQELADEPKGRELLRQWYDWQKKHSGQDALDELGALPRDTAPLSDAQRTLMKHLLAKYKEAVAAEAKAAQAGAVGGGGWPLTWKWWPPRGPCGRHPKMRTRRCRQWPRIMGWCSRRMRRSPRGGGSGRTGWTRSRGRPVGRSTVDGYVEDGFGAGRHIMASVIVKMEFMVDMMG